MLKKDKKSIDNKYFRKQIILVLIIVIYILSLSFIFGRYAVEEIKTHLVSSKEFYFYSDKLSEEEGTEYHINWSGNGECRIPINIYTKLNSLKTTKRDIEYKVEYTLESNNAICKLDKEEGKVLSYENLGTNTDTFELCVIPNADIGEDETIEVVVSVSTIDDFQKTLTTKFVITRNNEEVLYKIDDEAGRAYLNLIISNSSNITKSVTVNFDTGEIIIDTTNPIFTKDETEVSPESGYVNQVIFNMEPWSNINIKFFKKDVMQNYTNTETELDKGNILRCKFQEI